MAPQNPFTLRKECYINPETDNSWKNGGFQNIDDSLSHSSVPNLYMRRGMLLYADFLGDMLRSLLLFTLWVLKNDLLWPPTCASCIIR